MRLLGAIIGFIAIVIFFSYAGAASVLFLSALDTGEPIDLNAVLQELNIKPLSVNSLGAFFTLLGLWLAEAGIVGKRRLENWNQKIKDWINLRGSTKVLTQLAGLIVSLFFVVYCIGAIASFPMSGLAIGAIMLMVIFIFPSLIVAILIFLAAAFSLFLYRAVAHLAEDDVLDRTFRAIGLLSGTVGVFLLLN
jgi:uncharacterized protein YacL